MCDPVADPDAWVFRNTDLTVMDVVKGVNAELFGRYMAKRLRNQTVTAYNIEFDRLMIQRDMPAINDTVEWGPCLMERSSMIGDIPRRHAGKNRYPTAEATYNYLCPDDPCDLYGHEMHRALDDARMEAHILLRLHERGLFSVGESA